MGRKNFRKIPSHIRAALAKVEGNSIIVATVQKVTPSNVGEFAHLKLAIADGALTWSSPVTPPPDAGATSRRNLEGWVVIRKDLPKTTQTFSIDLPNWGDWSNGSHTVEWTREVYQRDHYAAKGLHLLVEQLPAAVAGEFLVKFSVGRTLDRAAVDFEEELLFDLNLLQENVGGATVFAADVTVDQLLRTIQLDWEILPPGQRGATIAAVLSKYRAVTAEVRTALTERYDLLESLNPTAYISGTNGFRRYFGAQFGEDLVVFENIDYGNALYVMYASWRELSRRSRIELLAGLRDGFDRIIHRSGWEETLRALIERRRPDQAA